MVYLEPHTNELEKTIISEHEGRVVYDYTKLVEYFFQDFCSHENISEDVAEKNYDLFLEIYDSAVDWVHYNVIRSLPYMEPKAPLIVEFFYPEEDTEIEEEIISIENIKYKIIK